jgi:hypothetical protein
LQCRNKNAKTGKNGIEILNEFVIQQGAKLIKNGEKRFNTG